MMLILKLIKIKISHSCDPEKHRKLIMKKPTYEICINLNRVNTVCNIQRKILSDIPKLNQKPKDTKISKEMVTKFIFIYKKIKNIFRSIRIF